MTVRAALLLLLFSWIAAGCGDDNGTNPPPVTPEDWSFTADSTKFSATLAAAKDTFAVGEAFDVKLILYNVPAVFGLTAEFTYPSDLVEIIDVLQGPHFAPPENTLVVKNIEAGANRVSFGVTFRRTTGTGVSGSGAVLKLKCRARAAGAAAITFNVPRFEVRNADGALIPNFGTLVREDESIVIR
jgi:hypothetical protein